jgi:Aspartyl/Asparaginyl beta-hydroxylase
MNKTSFDFVQLPFQFDEEKLLVDLKIALEHQWPAHFNKADYLGNWEIISLRSKSGNETDINAFSQNQYLETSLMYKCVYLKEITDTFQCNKEAVRLMNLKAKSEIKSHTDNAGGYADGFCRIHVPITTNEKVSFVVNGNQIPMKVGEAWYGNFSQPHSVKNEGELDRIHLVIDCIRNSWTDKLFEKMNYDFNSENKKQYDNQTKLQIIAQLELMNTPTSNQMAEKLKKEF